MNLTAEDVLNGYTAQVLKEIAGQAGLASDKNTKEALVKLLRSHLFDPKRIRRELDGLDAAEREALGRLVERGGETTRGSLETQVVEEGVVEPNPQPAANAAYTPAYVPSARAGSRVFGEVLARLTVKGLVFSRDFARPTIVLGNLAPARNLFIPDEILRHLPRSAPRPPHLPTVEVSRSQPASPRAFQRDLFLYWSFVRWNPVALTQRELVSKRDLVKLNAGLQSSEDLSTVRTEDEAGRLLFLRLMLTAAGLVTARGTRLAVAEGAQDFFKLGPAERTRRCFDTWLSAAGWNELLRIPNLYVDVSRNRVRDAAGPVLKARHFVVEQLKRAPAGEWFALDAFIRHCRLTDVEFLFERQGQPWGWYAGSYTYSNYGNLLQWGFGVRDDQEGWNRVEGGFIRAVLSQALHWLGLVDLGYAGDQLVAVRLTPAGAQVLGLPVEPEPELPAGKLILQPNFHLLAIDPVGEYTLSVLDTFADRTRVDLATEYNISRDSVYRAHQAGMEVDAILRFLEDACQTDVPQNVRRTLEEWAADQDRVVIRRGVTLLQAADAALLDRLLADPVVGRRLARRVSPEAALVVPARDDAAEMKAALEQMNLLPATSRPGEDASGAVAVEPDGTVRFRHPAPSFYVRARLAPFTDAGNSGALRITPDSLRRGVAAGLTVEGILETLQALHGGSLPEALVQSVKAWGRYYGPMELEDVTLLHVQDESVLSELRRDPALRGMLKSFAPRGALAVVKKGEVEKLRQALLERGVEITGDDE